MIDKSHMFFGNKDVHYGDGHSIPRVTYRCQRTVAVVGSSKYTTRKHECKLVTDHPKSCLCICGLEFNNREDK